MVIKQDLVMVKSKIINFFGGPGIGKSTQAAGLYSIMKKKWDECRVDL